MNLKDQRVLVVGTGISGIAACELLLAKEAHPILFDGNENLDVSKLYEKAPQLKVTALFDPSLQNLCGGTDFRST